MYKLIRESDKLPNWVKILLDILLTITLVYLIGFMVYKILDILRLFLNTMTEKKVYWIALGIVLICSITTLCILEFTTDVKPFTIMGEWFMARFNDVRNSIADIIAPKE